MRNEEKKKGMTLPFAISGEPAVEMRRGKRQVGLSDESYAWVLETTGFVAFQK